MYTLGVKRSFIAQHYLVGGDFGKENQWHSHHYQVEIRLSGQQLDNHGYLLDITEIEYVLDALLERYSDATLNELPEFEDLNPSIEHFARIIHDNIAHNITSVPDSKISVRLWEDSVTWTEFTPADESQSG